jgi:hypothetical protein
MTVIGGRRGRPDDWDSQHARARARAAERLDRPLDADEAAWLDGHLASCDECAAIAADYAAQRLELRALREPAPVPPRDLWARTAAAIEQESRNGVRGRARRSSLRPFALLAGALVVAIAVGTLTSSQWLFGNPTTAPGTQPPAIAVATPSPVPVAPTPLAVGPKDVAYVSIDKNGTYNLHQTRINEVCPSGTTDCVTSQPHENTQPIGPLSSPETVYGASGKPLVVLGSGDNGSSLTAILVPTQAPAGGASEPPTESLPATTPPAITVSPTATATVAESGAPSSSGPPATPSVAASPTSSSPASESPSPSQEPTPSPSLAAAQSVEIARDLEVLETNAGYAPDGSAFAFTAQPTDGSHGPDIYVWRVGDKDAKAVTSDHHSVFGSWEADGIVGSSLDVSSDGASAAPKAIVVRNQKEPVALPGAGSVWRPVVDATGANAVYWTGDLAWEGDGWKTGKGRLVIGRWGDAATAPNASAVATAPAESDQPQARHETTIAEGPLRDWDARWDETGTKLAVWVADAGNPAVGKLSLYVVNQFDGSIDLAGPPLKDEPAMAGFSIADGRLAWASPADGSSDGGRVLVLAWTDDNFGQVETAPGDFVLVR